MASVDSQPTWVSYPYEVTKDCSQGFCSIYCPQRCYSIFSPPPTPVFDFSDGSSSSPSSSAFSPLLIAIIGILATAFLLVSYYTIVSKYCGSFESLLRRQQRNGGGSGEDDTGGDGQLRHNEVWRASVSDGLEESVIRSITVCKYKKGDGFVDGTDCSVCLAEFREEEYLRLLPKCSHAFHVQCIDAWLKSHSNCPLCRSIVVSPATVLPPVLLTTSPEPEDVNRQVGEETATVIDINDVERRVEEQEDRVLPKGQGTVLISVDEGLGHRGDVVDVRGEDRVEAIRRRSASMDEAACQERISIADVLEMDMEGNGCAFSGGTAGSSRSSGLQDSSVLRRSFSGGRLHFLKNHHRHGNGNSAARSVASVAHDYVDAL